MENHEIKGDRDAQRLYNLIWKRTIASQMADAELEKTTVDILISSRDEKLVAKGEVIKFEGLSTYTETLEEETEEGESLLPPMTSGQELMLEKMLATQKFTRPSARYTEASLVRKLEELGIGRPSTYAPTISTVQKREYVEKKDKEGVERVYIESVLENGKVIRTEKTESVGAERNKLFPTDLGILVTDFLTKNFPQILDYHFTANVEEQFDEIAIGKVEWQKMIDGFYKPFHEHLVKTTETAQKVTGERFLGNDPKSGEPIKVMMGRYGPMVVLGETLDPKEAKNNPDAKKPKFAGLLKEQNMQDITLEEALKLFALPKNVGTYRDDEVVIGVGRFGPYVRNNSKFYSIPKGTEALSVTLEDAIQIILNKEKSDEENGPKIIKDFPEHKVQVLNGRYGPYIKKGTNNYKIPKDMEAEALELEDVLSIIGNSEPTKGRRKFTRKN
ncbi:MAG: DNA topoisomerase [Chitinophagales bacterium]